MTQKIKETAVVIIVIIIAFVAFKYFAPGQGSSTASLVSDEASTGQFVDGQTILNLLNNLNKVVLDDSIFSNKTFVSLVNFERPIQDQVAGRANPFSPIGVDGSLIILPRSTSTLNVR